MNTTKKAFALKELLVILFVLAVIILSLISPLRHARELARRVQCGAQLSGIGRAISLYQRDYKDYSPVTFSSDNLGSFGMGLYNTIDGYEYTRWLDTTFTDWETQPTAGSCLYLLVSHTDLIPRMFLCPTPNNDPATGNTEMDLGVVMDFCENNNLPVPKNWGDLNDFQSLYNLGYSNNDPWRNLTTAASPPNLAVMADKNPAYDTETGITNTNFNYDPTNPESGNSFNHYQACQNVLLTDWSVKRTDTPTFGIEQDNIYTHWPNAYPNQQQRTVGRYNQGHSAAPNDAYLGN